MNRRSRLRKQAGFTFTEVLAAMAILILLLSFSIPAGITMRNRIKHQELEDIARAVYVAAQNTLTRLAASGQTEELDGISMSGFDAPSDIPSETRWETERLDYYYAQNGSDTAKLLLPLGSIDDTVRSGGSYVIEYNKKTSMVYGVFYGKQDFDYRKIGYTEHSFRTDKSVRKSYMIGYYGGSEVERDEFVRCEKPVIQIRNDNVLEAKISGWKSGYMITVTLTDGQNTCGVSQEKLTLNPDGSYTLPLDRLTDDPVEKGRFHERYSTLQPGADLTVSVVFSAAGQISSEASAQTNSLFAARSDDTVSISCARHLQNLDVSYSGVTSDVRKAVQTAALDWTESFYFKSIDNQNLVSYNGNGLEIRALRAENGLFERVLSPDFESKELSGIRIVNPVIRHNGMSEASGAGALAGQTRNVVIRDCGVYAYQLAGETGGTLSVDYDRYLDYGVSAPGGIPAGGLIGEAENSRVEKSFAALPYLSAPAGAGLIGRAADCTISKSYAACDDLRGKALLIGETMAGSRQTEVSDSYAVGNRAISGVTSTPFVFGTADIRNSYYVMSYQSRNGDVLANSEYYVYRADGERRATDQETLSEPAAWNWLIGGEWTALSATLTYPYRKMLDGRPYPYPAGLAHYGSWPTDGTVEVSVKMELWPSGADGTHAGKVILRDEDGVILYQNDKEELNQSIHVKPGTKLTVEIEASEGYLYQQVQIDGKYDTEAAREFTVEKDTLVTVTFQQMAFKLTCGKASYTAGTPEAGASYKVYLPEGGFIESPAEGSVVKEIWKDTLLKVETSAPDKLYVASVWYVNDETGETVPVPRDESGLFQFVMPGYDATLRVQFTKQYTDYEISCYVMDTDGRYPDEPDYKATKRYGIGEVIGRNLLTLFVNESNTTVSVEDQNVLYFAEGSVSEWNEKYRVRLNDVGEVLAESPAYTTVAGDNGKTFKVKLYVARKQYRVTLKAGENIAGVGFGTAGTARTAIGNYYYGKRLTAAARVEGNNTFTAWTSEPPRFKGSSDMNYAIEVPHFDLELTATARTGHYLVRLNLLEDKESWLKTSPSRSKKDVSIELVDSVTGTAYPMTNLDSLTESYISEAIVPAILEPDGGYYIRVDGKEYYTTKGNYYKNNQMDDRVKLPVRNKGVESNVHFFSVMYKPNAEKYSGTLPEGGTYLYNHWLRVPGNTGMLRNLDDEKLVFAGWRDVYAGTGLKDSVYTDGEEIRITRKTDFFAHWEEKSDLQVVYDPNGADGGELPMDANVYQPGDKVPVQFGSLTRKGHTFLGWSLEPDGELVYEKGKEAFHEIGSESVTFYAKWELNRYSVTCYDEEGRLLTGDDYAFTLPFSSEFTVPDYESTNGVFVGWRVLVDGVEETAGAVVCRPKEWLAVLGETRLYAVVAPASCTVTFMDQAENGWQKCGSLTVGTFIPTYFTMQGFGKRNVTGWSTEPDGKGSFYPCDENSRTISPVAFGGDTVLYAVFGKVYNYQRQSWYDTVGEAVSSKQTWNGDTLIVYRDTAEKGQIRFDGKSLYIIAKGDHTAAWEEKDDSLVEYGVEDAGCMLIQSSSVTLGSSSVPVLSMGEGDSLTFNAKQKSRVIAVMDGGTLEMYDGVTLTGGQIGVGQELCSNGKLSAADRGNFGGGVYAGKGAVFNMHGGTIRHCSAVSGGGVYLYTGSKMTMGDMGLPAAYSSTAIYYRKDGSFYKNADGVTRENYRNGSFYVTAGDPVIAYNTSRRGMAAGYGTGADNDGGGGLMMVDLNDGDLILYRGTITGNTTYANGGGVMTDNGHNGDYLRIYEVEISHNSAYKGGGLYQWQGTLYIYNSVIRQNHAYASGGGIYLRNVYEVSNIEFYFGDIAYNKADQNGGAVYVEQNSTMLMHGGELYGNSCAGNGGGICLAAEKAERSLVISAGSLHDNRSDNKNGGRENDVYLNRNAVITVPAGYGGLGIHHSEFAEDSKWAAVDCADAYEGRTIVRYDSRNDFKEADADEFVYLGALTGLRIVPDSTVPDLKLNVPGNRRTVYFDAAGGEITEGNEWISVSVKDVIQASDVPKVTRKGYELIGWTLDPDAFYEEYVFTWNGADGTYAGQYTVTEKYDQRLYAVWMPYELTYDINIDTKDAVTAPFPAKGPVVKAAAPDKTSCKDNNGNTRYFHGWALNKEATVPDYFEDDLIAVDRNMTVYGVWGHTQLEYFTVTFEPNGAIGEKWTRKVVKNGNIMLPDYTDLDFVRVGYVFMGWGVSAPNANYMWQAGENHQVYDNLTLYAVWKRQITLHSNNGSNMTAQILEGESLKSAEAYGLQKPGDIFLFWNTMKDGEGQNYWQGDPVPDVSDLYAQWQPKPKAKIVLYQNKNKNDNDSIERDFGELDALGDGNTYGFKFGNSKITGWSKVRDPKNGDKVYPVGTYPISLPDDFPLDKVTVLYAQWK